MAQCELKESFGFLHSQLLKEWNHAKNTVDPFGVRPSHHSQKQAWTCQRGHAYYLEIRERVRGRECPECSGPKTRQGINDLLTLYPELLAEFDTSKNDHPMSWYAFSSNKPVWWRCKAYGHEWELAPNVRTAKGRITVCPVCSNRIVVPGFNDLATHHPQLALEFDVEKNETTPDNVGKGAGGDYWWRCLTNRNHSWKTSLINRVFANSKCPHCTKNHYLRGETDLLTVRPDIAAELDVSKTTFKAEDVHYAQDIMAPWKCEQGHTWETTVRARTHGDTGCPHCGNSGTSDIESRLRDALQLSQNFTDIQEGFQNKVSINLFGTRKKVQVDVVGKTKAGVPVIVFYDGWRYHMDLALRDEAVTWGCLEEGYTVIRVREKHSSALNRHLPNLPVSHERFFTLDYVYKNKKHGNLPSLVEEIERLVS